MSAYGGSRVQWMGHAQLWVLGIGVFIFLGGPRSGIAFADQFLELELRQAHYLGGAPDVDQRTEYTSAAGRYRLEIRREFKATADFIGNYSVGGQDHDRFSVPELFVATPVRTPSWELTIGRRKMNWSELDQKWALGLYNPQLRWDPLQPVEEGLIGAFLQADRGLVKVRFFASSLFLPEIGDKFDVDQGAIHSKNRFFSAPARRFVLGESTGRLHYEVKSPSWSRVINQPSAAIWTRFGDEMSGLWFQAGLARKPKNQFYLVLDPKLTPQNASVDVRPFVVNHTLTEMEVGYNGYDYKTWVGAIWEVPEQPSFPGHWITTGLGERFYTGAHVMYKVPRQWIPSTWMGWSYLKSVSAGSSFKGGLLDKPVPLAYADRIFSDALAIELESYLWPRLQKRLQVGLQYIYSFSEQGSVSSAHLRYSPQGTWSLQGSFDILTSYASNSDDGEFIYRNRSNDRVQGAIVYVF